MTRSRSAVARGRAITAAAVFLAVLSGGAAGVARSADANTFVVGRGASAAELRRPGVSIDAWTYARLSASSARPQGVALAWTEVSRARAPHRWWWKTYTSWCAEGRCSRPVLALKSRRAGRRTSPNTATPWRVWVSADPTRDRAVVKAGVRWGSRWAITSRVRLIGRGPTDNVWNAGSIGITHTPDGQDWLSWNDDNMRIRVSRARNGQRLSGPVVAQGGAPRVRNIGGRWVLLWYGQTDDDDLDFPANITSAPTITGLRAAPRTRLVQHTTDNLLRLLGPDEGPLFAVWWSDEKTELAQPIHGVWIDSAGTISPPQALADSSDATVRSVPSPSGGLTLCPWNVTAPLGGTFVAQPVACDNAAVQPIRLK